MKVSSAFRRLSTKRWPNRRTPHCPTVKDRLQASNRESITKDTAYRARRHRRQLQRRFAVAGARCITRAGFELRVELKWPNSVLWD
eukprot:COSAG04_NODE_911_length_9469_cov_11.221025_3_plen_86_part_00